MGVHLLVWASGPGPMGSRPPDICNAAQWGDEDLLQNAAHHLPFKWFESTRTYFTES